MSFIKNITLGTAVFATSVGATYFTLNKVNGSSSSSYDDSSLLSYTREPVKETAGQRLLSSLLSYEAMGIDGDIKITLENRDQINLALSGQGTIADINNIQILADMDLSLAGINAKGQFGYFQDTLTFSVDEICNFKLKTDDLMSFIEMIPTYGVSIELPDSLANLDTTTLLDKITGIEDEDVRTLPTGERFYVVELGEGDEAISIDVLASEDNDIRGIKIDRLDYQGTELSLRINLSELSKEELNITNPLEGNDKDKYQDFKPMFTLIDNFYSLVNQSQFGLKITANVAQNDKTLVDSELLLNVDKDANKVGLDISLYGDTKEDGSKNKYTINTAYVDGTIYAKYHNLALSIDTLTISNLIDYVAELVKDEFSAKITKALEGGIDTSSIDINDIFGKIKNALKKINVNEGSFELVLNINDFNDLIDSESPILPSEDIVIRVNFDDHKVASIELSPITISGFTINLNAEFTDYQTVNIIDPESYVRIEASDILVESILEFIDQKSYYIGFDIDTDDNDNSTTDLTMDGYIQLDFTGDNHYGYGSATIVDNKAYRHNLKADMYDQGNFIFTYNDKLKGKFTSETVFELADLVKDIVNNPDEHFYELFGELLDKLNSGTIARIIAGEYTLALEYEIISNLQINDSKTSFDLNLAIFGMDDMNLHMEIGYSHDDAYTHADLDYIKISNLKLGDKDITVDVDFAKYKTSLDSTRLNQFDTYLDFSCIKTLLALGVNTSKFNYFHFTGKLNLNIGLFGDGKDLADIGLDAKIRNEHGNVTVAIALTNIPIVKWVGGLIDLNSVPGYDSTDSRNAYIYYQHFEDKDQTDYWYINREDVVTEKGDKVSGFIFNRKYQYTEYKYNVTRKCTNEYFLDNIADILLKDILGISNNTILNAIDSSSLSSDNEIKYEEILSDFYYLPSKNSFFFDINMKALTGMSIFDIFEVTVYEDPTNNILKGLSAKIRVNLGVKITATFNLDFVDDRSVDVFVRDAEGKETTTPLSGTVITSANEYIASHQGDAADTDSSSNRTVIRSYVA